eukprot:1141699-Pelagomonas_calceolata.AAC.2
MSATAARRLLPPSALCWMVDPSKQEEWKRKAPIHKMVDTSGNAQVYVITATLITTTGQHHAQHNDHA